MSVLDYQGSPYNNSGQLTINASEHYKAVNLPTGNALIKMLDGWEEYAKAHRERYAAPIGEDYILGPYWAKTGLAIKRLLDGETGGLDCGSVAANIINLIESENFETDGYDLIEKE